MIKTKILNRAKLNIQKQLKNIKKSNNYRDKKDPYNQIDFKDLMSKKTQRIFLASPKKD